MVELGLADLIGDEPTRRMPGLRNLVVFGHATTQAIQNLRSVEPAFDEWYGPVQAELRADPLMKFFWDLRSQILKEGSAGPIGNAVHIKHLNTKDLQPILSNPPPGARGFFIGDAVGGSGWEIRLPDGSTTKYYIALPPEVSMEHTFRFEAPPVEHRGQPLPDMSVQALSRAYVDGVRRLNDARATVWLSSAVRSGYRRRLIGIRAAQIRAIQRANSQSVLVTQHPAPAPVWPRSGPLLGRLQLLLAVLRQGYLPCDISVTRLT